MLQRARPLREAILVDLVVLPGWITDRRVPLMERGLVLLTCELNHVLVHHHDAGTLLALVL